MPRSMTDKRYELQEGLRMGLLQGESLASVQNAIEKYQNTWRAERNDSLRTSINRIKNSLERVVENLQLANQPIESLSVASQQVIKELEKSKIDFSTEQAQNNYTFWFGCAVAGKNRPVIEYFMGKLDELQVELSKQKCNHPRIYNKHVDALFLAIYHDVSWLVEALLATNQYKINDRVVVDTEENSGYDSDYSVCSHDERFLHNSDHEHSYEVDSDGDYVTDCKNNKIPVLAKQPEPAPNTLLGMAIERAVHNDIVVTLYNHGAELGQDTLTQSRQRKLDNILYRHLENKKELSEQETKLFAKVWARMFRDDNEEQDLPPVLTSLFEQLLNQPSSQSKQQQGSKNTTRERNSL